MYMYSSYLQEMVKSSRNLWIGVNTDDINSLISSKGGNLHCAYLQFHSAFGLIPLLFMLYSLLRTVLYLYRKGEYDQLIVLLVFMFRSLFDQVFTGTLGDIVIFYYFLLPDIERIKDTISFRSPEIEINRQ